MTWEPSRVPSGSAAAPEAVVRGPGVRFTVLTSRLIRLECSPSERFEDRPSQAFWSRQKPVPLFEVVRDEGRVEVVTEHLHVRYVIQREGFTRDSLSIEIRGSGAIWHYGDDDPLNLQGTARTLDLTSGGVDMGQGLLSRSGWAVVDDSKSLVFDGQGWIENRSGSAESGGASDDRDLYFFGYGYDYVACIQDFCRVAGPVPLLPRWALGNWWSRYWDYSQQELTELMSSFREHEVPLSVCIVDMDWHITDTGNSSSGWTGYTWNRDLFPDPEAFLAWLHDQGLRTALNVHPAAGVHPHEAAYPEMARALGMDPTTEEPVRFAIHDPAFARVYFELLHHPLESMGVDFWWLDWQQGTLSGLPGLDPLFWLNHLHFHDLARDGRKRPFVFSRWGGLGNHRYQIGFSGDTHVTWESLALQPHFTATASNVAYGWWSHDIGGHMYGVEEPELYARWVHFGLFNPILRLHCTKNAYHERRPWAYDAETSRVIGDAMRMRHAFIPYLYSMSWRNHSQSLPLISPMYHTHPESEEAYSCSGQYWFGSELLAAPVVSRADADTGLSRQVVWLPEGDWFGFFDGERYSGGGWQATYNRLDEIPVFARAGGIIPLGPAVGWGGVENPDVLEVNIFPGADNRFELFEDDGASSEFEKGHYSVTSFAQTWSDRALGFFIEPVEGDTSQTPAQREYTLLFRSISRPGEVRVEIDGAPVEAEARYDAETETLRLSGLVLRPENRLAVSLSSQADGLMTVRDRTAEKCRRLLRSFRLETGVKAKIDGDIPEILTRPAALSAYLAYLTDSQVRALVEVISGAGVDTITQGPLKGSALLWNNRSDPGLAYSLSARKRWSEFHSDGGIVPPFKIIENGLYRKWRLKVDCFGLTSITVDGGSDSGMDF